VIFKPFLRFVLPALVLGLLAGGASAQGVPAAKPAPTQASPVPPAITPSHLAAARAVIVSSGLGQSFDPVIPELMSEIYLTITRTRPELAPDMTAVLNQLKPEFTAHEVEMVNNAALIAASEIDEADLDKIAAFFNSTAGKKYVSAQPDMLQRMMTTTHAMASEMSAQMMSRVREEMKKRGKQM
jgi:hypothetical protein